LPWTIGPSNDQRLAGADRHLTEGGSAYGWLTDLRNSRLNRREGLIPLNILMRKTRIRLRLVSARYRWVSGRNSRLNIRPEDRKRPAIPFKSIPDAKAFSRGYIAQGNRDNIPVNR
jgi:hypothetical protein